MVLSARKSASFRGSFPHIRLSSAGFGRSAPDVTIKPILDWDFDRITAYDTSIHHIPRHRFLQACLRTVDRGLLAEDSTGAVCGYALLEKKPFGTKVFPVYADRRTVAEKLLLHIVENLPPGEQIQVCIPSANADAVDLFVQLRCSLHNCTPTELLSTRGPHYVPMHRVFATLNICNGFA